MNGRTISALLILAVFGYVGVWKWFLCRIYVGPGEMLVITSQVGKSNTDPENLRVVDEGFQGVRKHVLAEGRHFLNPFLNVRKRAHTIVVGADEVGIVKSKTGKPLPAAEFLVNPGKDIFATKGVWRDVLTPGTWRLNPTAFDVEITKATRIPPGYVGCVTSLSGKDPGEGALAEEGERGIRREVLQPGIYYLNPKELKIEPVIVGFQDLSLDDVSFPSKDGFPIQLDITVVWGLAPADVPNVMMHFGNAEQVVDKILKPQIESICRIEGSKYGAKELIEGDTREAFQHAFTASLTKVCKEKNITVRLGLVRAIEIPLEIRQPIQQARVAMEEGRTKAEQQITQAITNKLSELQSDVDKGVREVAADTEKAIAEVRAQGEKKVAEIQAQRMVESAVLERQVAELAAERTRQLGKADAAVVQLANEAEADRLKQNVDAIGGGDAFGNYQFANNLPANFKVFIRYAGPGTFWTDMPQGAKGLREAADMKILENAK